MSVSFMDLVSGRSDTSVASTSHSPDDRGRSGLRHTHQQQGTQRLSLCLQAKSSGFVQRIADVLRDSAHLQQTCATAAYEGHRGSSPVSQNY
jgi:hypothetical protein